MEPSTYSDKTVQPIAIQSGIEYSRMKTNQCRLDNRY